MNKKFSIIGGGLAGLTVACALADSGCDNFAILDVNTPDEIKQRKLKGLMYLHENPMLLEIEKQSLINVIYTGLEGNITLEEADILYRKKIGMHEQVEQSSILNIKVEEKFYDVKKYRNILLEKFKDNYFIIGEKIHADLLGKICENSIKTFFTIPITEIIKTDNNFKSIPIYGKESLPPDFISDKLRNFSNLKEDYVIYNVSDKQQWYRSSFINNRAWLESTDKNFGELIGYKIISDPSARQFWIKQNLFRDLIPVGRYAMWTRTMLLHHVYNTVKLSLYGGEIIGEGL